VYCFGQRLKSVLGLAQDTEERRLKKAQFEIAAGTQGKR